MSELTSLLHVVGCCAEVTSTSYHIARWLGLNPQQISDAITQGKQDGSVNNFENRIWVIPQGASPLGSPGHSNELS
ncbi:hypothetical protein K0M31_018598 [Melipona bicolor]|uniref:Uncharacterized protein n=1 Tax=Melipona bicolor TaxID=60889 RepID=A0AA40G3N8_9HYME|nr:hypothetical protein K0M31_018598 [Melipona bicolor]